MPLPKPNRTETKTEFVERFLRSEDAKREFPNIEQRRSKAETQWRNMAE